MKNPLALKYMFVSFGSKNFRFFFIGQFISQIGSWMESVALGWLVFSLTGSISLLATVSFVGLIPHLLLSPIIGAIIDRVDKFQFLRILQCLMFLQALVLSILTLCHLIQVWHIVVLSCVLGVMNACERPLRLSIITDFIRDKKKINNAIALNSVMMNGSRLIGPAIAGMLIALIGEGYCFLGNTISYIAVIVAFSMMDYKNKKPISKKKNILIDMQEGYQYVKNSFPLRTLMIMVASIGFLVMSIIGIIPAYIQQTILGNSYTMGYFLSSIGMGSIVAALYLTTKQNTESLPKMISISGFIASIGLIILGFLNIHWVVYLLCFPIGFAMIACIASCNTMIQTISNEDKKGRVMSFYALCVAGTSPIGTLLFGYLAESISIGYTFVIQGILMLIIATFFEKNRYIFSRFSRIVITRKYRKMDSMY
ncbi:MAG: MFS transporter [Chitinophagaceae bacterium]